MYGRHTVFLSIDFYVWLSIRANSLPSEAVTFSGSCLILLSPLGELQLDGTMGQVFRLLVSYLQDGGRSQNGHKPSFS